MWFQSSVEVPALCGSCVAAYEAEEARLFELCAAGSDLLDWPEVVRNLPHRENDAGWNFRWCRGREPMHGDG